MEEAPLLGGMSGPEDEIVPDLFGAESRFVSENIQLKGPMVVKAEEDEFHVFPDAYLSPADPKEPLLHAFNPPLNVDCKNKVKVELLVDENEEEILGEYPSLPDLNPLEDAVLPAAPPPPPPAYNVHFLSSLLTPHRSPAVVPLGTWAREGAAHPGVRVIPVELKEGGGTLTSNNAEEATFQTPPAQESSCKFPSSQEAEDASGCSHKENNPMVICQLKGGTQMLCIDNSGTRELKALHLVPQYQDQNNYLQSDVPKPMTALVGRLLPVPAKLNLITQQLDTGALPPTVGASAFPSGPTLPGPPKMTLAGYCDCFASGDFCNNCNCNNCCNNLRHEIERFKAIKAKIMCSSICKCIGCKNYEESPERKTLMTMPNNMEAGGFEGGHHLSPTKFAGLPKFRKERWPSSCISREVVEAACACLLAQGEEAEKERCSECLAEQMILEEFGRCLSQILHIEFKSKGLKVE
uniref:Testis expressed metallothionein like protein n=1 Tax=Rousettus aegyptiacus TaxID=9407 RepID=A0A7J8H8I5_ROUAE|nr:testis expressed metallothionein like protein [Rousettus aegyptiacus]